MNTSVSEAILPVSSTEDPALVGRLLWIRDHESRRYSENLLSATSKVNFEIECCDFEHLKRVPLALRHVVHIQLPHDADQAESKTLNVYRQQESCTIVSRVGTTTE